MLTLVLTRHGLTDRSLPEQHLGQRIDISINEAGRRQAEALAGRLRGVPFQRVVTSPLFRARETAEIVVARTPLADGVAIEVDPRLKEMDYGAWEGRTYEDLETNDAEARAAWVERPDELRCPGGESGNDVAARTRAFLADLLDEHRRWRARAELRATTGVGPAVVGAERAVLAVAHSTSNRVLLCVALGHSVREYRRRFVQGQGNITVLRWTEGAAPEDGQLLLLNDLAHLRAAGEAPWG
jgi:broad specificity phosphatase PhoE